MRHLLLITCIFTIISVEINSQVVFRKDLSAEYNLPDGVKLFSISRPAPKLKAWYYEIDLKKNIAVKPYLNPVGREGLVPFIQRFQAYGGINGGYFDLTSGASYSALVNPGVVQSKNISTVVRDGKTYFLTRGFWGISEDRSMSIDWIYHFGNRIIDIYRYSQPLQNTQGTPAPAPVPTQGEPSYELLAGIGGGPVLIKNGVIQDTYIQEVFWGSGVGYDNRDPRSAIGFTQDGKVILFVADGRQTESEGLALPEMAILLKNMGVVELLNLDGGGSSQIATSSELINKPEGGTYQRPIPTMIAIVHPDSLPMLPPIYYNKKIDSEDEGVSFMGQGWSQSAIAGYWAGTPSKIAPTGSGENSVTFKLRLPSPGKYRLDAWWTSASNRSSATPFIIRRGTQYDTVKINQSINGSKWNLIGEFQFSGDTTESVTITNFAPAGFYVVADGIRILSFDSTVTEITGDPLITDFSLNQNYPNPFNPSTVISYSLPSRSKVKLDIFDILGNKITELVNTEQEAGKYEILYQPTGLSAGIYFYRLISESSSITKKMVYIR